MRKRVRKQARKVILGLAILVGCAGAAGWAQQQAPLLQPGVTASAPETRWSFKRVDDGFVRLDGRTGQVAHCTPVHAGWTCQAVPEERAKLEKQITDLKAEVDSLKKEVAALRAAPPPPPPPPPPEKGPAVSLRMPTQADIAHARDYVADTVSGTWHRLVRMIMHFQHDVLRKDS